ncbi:UDP-N-acetylglucosamine transferase subunit ALG13 homolog isoform X2 [Polyodon spathula]|uniref:UDP-N-acetylglucosamine transferase subunit ALG13 homolog isoform X2 n=1 Tax=Polyodon spathula TaxID=7913 RepID=UPI001B7DB199|nr:UDP-N-acetylglucosamine transferase subunit ALG13 homolog isoform X2 [Polyodon spathula]
MKSVFVTVGTTSFDELISCVTSEDVIQALRELGYGRLVLQIGRGAVQPVPYSSAQFTLEVFRYKDSITEEIRTANLVISHAGAGSCLETLGAGTPLLVVVNDQLMNNHQLELARQLHQDGHLYYCTCRSAQPASLPLHCRTLSDTLKTMDLSALNPFLPGQTEKFAAFLDKAVGLQ